MDRAVKLAIILGALLAGFGVFYHYVVFLPGAQRERATAAERERQEKATAAEGERQVTERRDLQRRIAYESCLVAARRNYDADWATACESVAATREEQLKNCLSDKSIISNRYLGPEHCHSTYGGADPSPECTLPKTRAESIDAR